MPDFKFTSIPKGMSNLASDLDVGEDEIRIIFDFDDSNLYPGEKGSL